MNVCFIVDNAKTKEHPVLGAALEQVTLTHSARLLHIAGLTGDQAIACEIDYPLADIYLLKSHLPQALEVARHLEERGALVINSFASSSACQDRALMAQRMSEAGLAFPRTWTFSSVAEILEPDGRFTVLPLPFIIKSRYSQRGDLVEIIQSIEQLRALAGRNREAVIVQEFAAGDGWDIKLWVIDQQAFAARRRTSLEPNASKENFPLATEELPSAWRSIALEIGRAFDLRLYGVDLVLSEQVPVVVDINSFPGFRGVRGAAALLVGLIERLANTGQRGGL